MKMKKLLSAVLAALMIMSLAACPAVRPARPPGTTMNPPAWTMWPTTPR